MAAAVPQRLLDRFRRLPSTVLSRGTRKTGNMSLTSLTGHDEGGELGLGLELGDGPRGVKSSAHAASAPRPRHGTADSAGLDAGMLNKGIVVTNEVTVTYTQEERIERIIGF